MHGPPIGGKRYHPKITVTEILASCTAKIIARNEGALSWGVLTTYSLLSVGQSVVMKTISRIVDGMCFA